MAAFAYRKDVQYRTSKPYPETGVAERFVTGAVDAVANVGATFDVRLLGTVELDRHSSDSRSVVTARLNPWVNSAMAALYLPGLLPPSAVQLLGSIGEWKFEAELGDRQDTVVWAVDHPYYLPDLIQTYAKRRQLNPRFKLRIGVNSNWLPVNITDLEALIVAASKYQRR